MACAEEVLRFGVVKPRVGTIRFGPVVRLGVGRPRIVHRLGPVIEEALPRLWSRVSAYLLRAPVIGHD